MTCYLLEHGSNTMLDTLPQLADNTVNIQEQSYHKSNKTYQGILGAKYLE